MTILRYISITLFSLLLLACGGGGGESGGSGSTSSTPGSTTPGVLTPTIVLSIVNATGASVNSVSLGGGFSVRATVLDGNKIPQSGKLVTFSVKDAAIASVNPTTALTNSSGVASVSLSPASISSVGATTVEASAVLGASNVSGKADFAVSASSLSLSDIRVGSQQLASGGNTSLAVTALIGGQPTSALPVNISFSATCGRINGGTGSFSVTTDGSGVASAVYTGVATDGSLCSGQIAVTAASAGAAAKIINLTIAAPVANALTYVSAQPSQIFVSGSGAAEQSFLKFRALSGTTPLANVLVAFEFTVNPGGASLGVIGSSVRATATTNATGDVEVPVFSGTIPGPVKVRASLVASPAIAAESQNITIASGPPSQRFMSLSATKFNIEGQNFDGASTKLTVRIADRQGNAVEDGTVINFTAEGGQVASSCATLQVNKISACSVDFISQNPRPVGGRVSVVAFTEGTKDYVDVNGNNRYDGGIDTLIQIGDVYRDDNEDRAFQTGEFQVPRGVSGATCPETGWPFPGRKDTCSMALATTVREQTVIFFSSSAPLFNDAPTFDVSVRDSNGTPVTVNIPGGTYTRSGAGTSTAVVGFGFFLRSFDNPLLPMPVESKVEFEMSDGTPGDNLTCSLDKSFGSPVANIGPGSSNVLEDRASFHSATFKDCRPNDLMTIKVTAPAGLTTIFQRRLTAAP